MQLNYTENVTYYVKAVTINEKFFKKPCLIFDDVKITVKLK